MRQLMDGAYKAEDDFVLAEDVHKLDMLQHLLGLPSG
jgi:hypothetical protein